MRALLLLLLLPLEQLEVLPLVDLDDFDSLLRDADDADDVEWWLLLSLCLRCWAAVATASCNCWRTSAEGCDGRALRISTVVDAALDDAPDAPPNELAGVTVNSNTRPQRGRENDEFHFISFHFISFHFKTTPTPTTTNKFPFPVPHAKCKKNFVSSS